MLHLYPLIAAGNAVVFQMKLGAWSVSADASWRASHDCLHHVGQIIAQRHEQRPLFRVGRADLVDPGKDERSAQVLAAIRLGCGQTLRLTVPVVSQ